MSDTNDPRDWTVGRVLTEADVKAIATVMTKLTDLSQDNESLRLEALELWRAADEADDKAAAHMDEYKSSLRDVADAIERIIGPWSEDESWEVHQIRHALREVRT